LDTSSNPAEDDGFLRAIKVCSTTSFGGMSSRRLHVVIGILQHVEDPCGYERGTSYAKFISHFFAKFLLLRYYISLVIVAREL
jgi:hypothetical protein